MMSLISKCLPQRIQKDAVWVFSMSVGNLNPNPKPDEIMDLKVHLFVRQSISNHWSPVNESQILRFFSFEFLF